MKNKKTMLIVGILLVISLIYTYFTTEMHKIDPEEISENLSVTYLDVGQGDSSFIEFPNGKCMLIDASISSMGEKIANHIAAKGYEKIDYLVATHPHSDHIGGMADITSYFEIGTAYLPDAVTDTKVYTNFLKTLKKMNVAVEKAQSGANFSEGDVKVEFLGPISAEYEDLNNYSAVVKITYNKKSFLFTGDAEDIVETELLNSGANLKADVLKVGHHGSSSSTTQEFLDAVDPEIAIISCGKDNDYGHPHKEVLNRLKDAEIKIYRTDVNGNIPIISNGLEVSNYYDLYN